MRTRFKNHDERERQKETGAQSQALSSLPLLKSNDNSLRSKSGAQLRRVAAKMLSRPIFKHLCAVGFVWCAYNSFQHMGNTHATSDFKKATRHIDIDFFVAGFQKYGMTELSYAFKRHPEIAITDEEYCGHVGGTNIDSNVAITLLKMALRRLPDSVNVKKGIICPAAARNAVGLEMLADFAPSTKIIIGLQNPVTFFQSFYNYRITESYIKNPTIHIPKPRELINNEWLEVSTDSARFEDSLIQLGKVEVSPDEIVYLGDLNLQGKGLQIFPNNFQIFLYTSEQLVDNNASRSEIFRKDLQNFLGLEKSIEPFTKENAYDVVLPEHMDICAPEHVELRNHLVNQSYKTRLYILSKFLKSDDVVVGGESHFRKLLNKWTSDPCENPSVAHAQNSPPV